MVLNVFNNYVEYTADTGVTLKNSQSVHGSLDSHFSRTVGYHRRVTVQARATVGTAVLPTCSLNSF